MVYETVVNVADKFTRHKYWSADRTDRKYAQKADKLTNYPMLIDLPLPVRLLFQSFCHFYHIEPLPF